MDPSLEDVDKVMKKYEEEDAQKELAQRKMEGDSGDPKGGIDKISASSIAHEQDDDNKELRKIFENYSSLDRGDDGNLDPEKRIITKWQGQLASEEAIRGWNQDLSDAALDKFMKENF